MAVTKGGTGTPGCTACHFPMLSIQGRSTNFVLASPVEGSCDSSKDSELPLKINAPVSYFSLNVTANSNLPTVLTGPPVSGTLGVRPQHRQAIALVKQ